MDIQQAKTIWEGWVNFLDRHNLSADQRRVAEQRLLSCSNCIYSKERWVRRIVSTFIDTITGRTKNVKEKKFEGYKCSICQCPLDQKTLSYASECPLPEYHGERYPHPQRWGRVSFNDDGTSLSPDNIYITEKN